MGKAAVNLSISPGASSPPYTRRAEIKPPGAAGGN